VGWGYTDAGTEHQDPDTRLVYDFYCGSGGVGHVLDDLDDVYYVGFDIERQDDYPGQMVQSDLDWQTNPCRGCGDLGWWSPPCTAYTPLSQVNHGSREAALEAEPRIPEFSVHPQSRELSEYYIIENVPGAARTEDFEPNVRLNGLAFDKPFDLERRFETNFPVPDAYLEGDPELVLGGDEWVSTEELAEAKEVPTEWDRQSVNEAMPRVYVEHLLWYCPGVKLSSRPSRVDAALTEFDVDEQPLDPFLFDESEQDRETCFRPVSDQYWYSPQFNPRRFQNVESGSQSTLSDF
jgi:hypothetical protein